MRRNQILLVAVLLVLGASGFWAQEKTQPEKTAPATTSAAPAPAATQAPAPVHVVTITEEDKARKNPVRFSELSVGRGAKLYSTQCAMCHGEKGDGKGEMVEEMKIHPPDFTKAATLQGRTDGELFAIINHGKPSAEGTDVMPSQAKRLSERHVWDLVNYLRSLAGKAPEKPTEQEQQEGTVVVPKKPPQP